MNENEVYKCLLCGSTARKIYNNLQGYQESETFEVINCEVCDVSFVLPMKVDEEIYNIIYNNCKTMPGYDRYYKYSKEVLKTKKPLEYLKENEDNYFGVVKSLENYMAENSFDKNKVEILEVGSGLGYLTYALAQNGYNIKGIDISERAVKEATNKYGNHYMLDDIFNLDDSNNEKFDIVILMEVIEHLTNPVLFLAKIHEILKRGGVVILTSPNKSAYPKDAIWNTDLPPVHLWWLSEKSMYKIANQAGFGKISFYDMANCPHASYGQYSGNNFQRKHVLIKAGKIAFNQKIYYIRKLFIKLFIKLLIKLNLKDLVKSAYLTIRKTKYDNNTLAKVPVVMCVILEK